MNKIYGSVDRWSVWLSKGHRTASLVPTAFAPAKWPAGVIGFSFAWGHNCNPTHPVAQSLTGTRDRLCIMKEALSRSLQNSMFELSEQIARRPKNRDEIDVWLETCDRAFNKCHPARLAYKAHREFHRC